MNNEDNPRVTITSERHDELLTDASLGTNYKSLGLLAAKVAADAIGSRDRARAAGRRLASIHKANLAMLQEQLDATRRQCLALRSEAGFAETWKFPWETK